MLITKRLRHILNNIEVIKVFLTYPSNITFLFSFFKLLSINNIPNILSTVNTTLLIHNNN